MTARNSLVKTLVFQLDVRSDNEHLLHDATREARSVYNETIRLAKAGVNQDSLPSLVADSTDLVKNTTQRIVAKALDAMENYHEYEAFNLPSHDRVSPYPLRANYGEGYDLTCGDEEVRFRISAKPYKHVTGALRGADANLDVLKSALTGEEWQIGTAEALFRDEKPELHVNITNTERTIRDERDSETVVGVDVNEDNVALSALSDEGVEDTLIIDFPEIKFERHRYFTIRKRVQKVGKSSIHAVQEGHEKRFVRDRLHKVSHHVVKWCQKFDRPCIVFEDLKEIRDSIDYGTRMNRRLHRLPFRALQFYISYKAAFEGIPIAWIDPKYTSQRCPLCGHIARANRHKKRFKCKECSHQDHSDRGASVNVSMKGIQQHQDWNVPALNSLPRVQKVRRRASGAVDAPSVTRNTECVTGVSE